MKRLGLALAMTGLLAGCGYDTETHAAADVATKLGTDATAPAPAAADIAAEDSYLWLEEVEGEEALETVRAWNARSLDRLTGDERFERFQSDALAIVNADDKVPFGAYRGGYVYNFWQDADSVRGILRRTSLDDYRADTPNWETLLDVDTLSAEEGANWVYKGSSCLAPDYTRCLLTLSEGGKDAAERREWDHDQKSFVEGGFFVPEAKSGVAWLDEDTLLIATDWGEGSLTESGYPFVLKRWSRGGDLDDASEVFRGQKTDVGIGGYTLETETGERIPFVYRSKTFYDTEHYWLAEGRGPVRLPIPRKSSLQAYFKGQLLVSLKEDWTPVADGETYPSGALVSFDLDAWFARQDLLGVNVVVAPSARSTVQSVSRSKSKLVITMLENVVGRAYAFDFGDGAWMKEPIPLPDNGTVGVGSHKDSDIAFIIRSSFTDPSTLYEADLNANAVTPMKQAPERFNADNLITEQFEALSSDGERIPYFVVRSANAPLNGDNPTLLYAYGGFQVSLQPGYSGIRGKLWLERGGIYVVANIRGGGEFGPDWHQAGLKTNRQIIYDDFIAVAEDLKARKITRPERLGIMGGSNGGLLMGVMYTQRPDLWNAVVCQVPLLDMLRYHKLLAGASWVGEYGSPDIAAERAFLESISPYHNVNPGTDYPEIFFVTSTKDDRVHPGHARKMAALLEELDHPFVYYENIDGGHSAAANLAERAKRSALEYVFLSQNLMDAPMAGLGD